MIKNELFRLNFQAFCDYSCVLLFISMFLKTPLHSELNKKLKMNLIIKFKEEDEKKKQKWRQKTNKKHKNDFFYQKLISKY